LRVSCSGVFAAAVFETAGVAGAGFAVPDLATLFSEAGFTGAAFVGEAFPAADFEDATPDDFCGAVDGLCGAVEGFCGAAATVDADGCAELEGTPGSGEGGIDRQSVSVIAGRVQAAPSCSRKPATKSPRSVG
jgi:hypothetical protein